MSERHRLSYSLSEEELLRYREHGFLIRERVFGGEELKTLIDGVERTVSKAFSLIGQGNTYHLDGKRFVDVNSMTVQFEHREGSDTIRVIEPVNQLDDCLEQLVRDDRVLEPVKGIIGCDQLSLWTNKLNLKRANEGSGFGWHQDSPYWVHDSDHVDLLPNVYLAFDDANRENGCLRVIDRSHLQGCLPGRSDGSQLGGFFTDPNYYSEDDEVLLEVPAGSLVFFDPHSIHGSQPNDSDESRRAIIMTYQPANFPMLKTGQVVNVS
jgi:phytanoyl-CoA hydroxylase